MVTEPAMMSGSGEGDAKMRGEATTAMTRLSTNAGCASIQKKAAMRVLTTSGILRKV
jgi:hypothetical protein